MPRLPNFSWLEVQTYAIQAWPPMAPRDWSAGLDPVNSAWHAGRVNDVIALPFPAPYQNSILAATDSGGVWEINPPNSSFPAGDALPLSDDWDSPDVSCLASDYGNPMRIWAGCRAGADYSGSLHEIFIDGMALDPWTSIPLPADTTSVLRIAIAGTSGRIVLAGDQGVFWSAIPARGGAYVWQPASGLPLGAYYGAATGRDPATGNETVVVGIRDQIADPQSHNNSVGIYVGAWEQGPGSPALRMRIPTVNGLDRTRMTDTSIGACRDRPEFMYALARDPLSNPVGQILGVLTSRDGGQTWQAGGTALSPGPGMPMTDIVSFSGDDKAGGRQKTIRVSPTDPQTVAFGWRNALISTDGGNQWQKLGPFATAPNSGPHLHDDVHAIYFDPQNANRLYIASDGGVATTPDLGASFSSVHNINLRNFQFYSTGIWRDFLGRFAASTLIPGLVAGGLQDNGNVYTRQPQQTDPRTGRIPPVPWITSASGDGGFAAFLATGQILQSDNGSGVLSSVHVLTPAFNGQLSNPPGPVVPLRNPGAAADPAGIISVALEVVPTPTFGRANNPNTANQLMQAVGAQGAAVFGLFAFGDGSDAHWEQLGVVPIDTRRESIAALATLDGNIIFVGTQGGRLFALTAASGFAAVQLPTPVANPQTGDAGAQIARIVVSATTLFLTFNRQGGPGQILRYARRDDVRNMNFEILDGVLQGNHNYYGLEWGDGNLYAATDKRVFISSDNGDTWQDASQGLPARPHCSDLRYIVTQDGTSALYLSTWGRSLWKADFTAATISGTVRDSQGDPVAGATVRVAESDPGIVPGIYTTTTDDAGHYSITLYPGLYTGNYSLQVFGPDIVEMEMALGRIPLGATVSQDPRLTRKGILTGQVVDATGAPIIGAAVLVGSGIPIVGNPGTFGFWTNTDATGHYSVIVDPPGPYNAVAAADSFENSDPAAIPIMRDTRTTQNFALVTARPGGIIGTVVDSDTQEPIAEATVEAIVYPTSDSRSTSTDATGNYTLSNVLSGPRQVTAIARYYGRSVKTVRVIAGQTVAVPPFSLTALPRRGSNGGRGSSRF